MQTLVTSLFAACVVLLSQAEAGAQSMPRHRTPDARFAGLKGYPYAPHYAEINGLPATEHPLSAYLVESGFTPFSRR